MRERLQAIANCVRPLFGSSAMVVWTAVATVLIAIFTFLLYQVSNRTNRTNQAIQRAYVNAGRIETGLPIREDGVVTAIRIDVPWRNSGTTPALNTSSRIGWVVHQDELPPDMPVVINIQDPSITAIGPLGETNTRGDIPIDYLQRAMSGERFYIVGWTTYRDIFPETRWRLTEFCWEILNIITDDIANPSRLQWTNTSCPGERTCYDERCPDYEQRIQERLDEDRARLSPPS